MSESTEKGSENLALTLSVVSIPLSIILFGFITAIASFFMSWKSRQESGTWSWKNLTALLLSLSGLFLSVYFGVTYRGMFLRWHHLQEESRHLIGMQVQPFHWIDIDGQVLDMSDFKGMPMVINLWATRCPPCKREIPQLSQMAVEFEGKVKFIGISMEPEGVLADFRKKVRITFPLVSEPIANLPEPLNSVRIYPTTFLVNREGVIQDLKIGFLPEELLRKWLSPIMTE